MDNKELVILAGKPTGGGSAVSSVNGQTGAVVLDYEDVGAAPAETVETVSGATPSIAANDNTLYDCGELSTLTITSMPDNGLFTVLFASGATATQIVWPQDATVELPEGQTIEANRIYEMSVRCRTGKPTTVAVGDWPAPTAAT